MVFVIGNIFPVTENYIDREYIDKNTAQHLVIKDKKLIDKIENKAKKYVAYSINKNMKRNIKSVGIRKIYEELTLKLKETQYYQQYTEKFENKEYFNILP